MKTCAITIIKNEHEYLREWIDYHIKIFDHLFIIEDLDSISHVDIINLYNKDIVSFMGINDVYEKLGDVNNCPLDSMLLYNRQGNYQSEALKYVISLDIYDWCMVMDVDEFLTFDGDLHQILSKYNKYAELLVYWKNYGANGHITKPDYTKKSFREYYTKPGSFIKKDDRCHAINKKFINLRHNDAKRISNHYTHHGPRNINYIKTDFTKEWAIPCYDVIYLKHYITKSFEEYYNKLYKRGMFHGFNRNLDSFFEVNPDMLPIKQLIMSNLDKFKF